MALEIYYYYYGWKPARCKVFKPNNAEIIRRARRELDDKAAMKNEQNIYKEPLENNNNNNNNRRKKLVNTVGIGRLGFRVKNYSLVWRLNLAIVLL